MSIQLTEVAAEEIRKVAAAQELDLKQMHLRVGVQGSGHQRRYVLDLAERMEPGDHVFSSRGIRMACPSSQLAQLNGTTIDFQEQEAVGWGFTFDVPPTRQVTREAGDPDQPPPAREEIRQALRQVIDPEVGLNVVDLGLIYGVETDGRDVRITMTMTTPACPMSDMIRRDVNERIRERCPGVDTVAVDLIWEPRWTPERMSPEGKQQLGWSR